MGAAAPMASAWNDALVSVEAIAPLTGAIDHFVDSTDVANKPGTFPHVASPFDVWVEAGT